MNIEREIERAMEKQQRRQVKKFKQELRREDISPELQNRLASTFEGQMESFRRETLRRL